MYITYSATGRTSKMLLIYLPKGSSMIYYLQSLTKTKNEAALPIWKYWRLNYRMAFTSV